jgi:hypothetical protein
MIECGPLKRPASFLPRAEYASRSIAWRSRQKSRLLPTAAEPMSEKAPQATFSNK